MKDIAMRGLVLPLSLLSAALGSCAAETPPAAPPSTLNVTVPKGGLPATAKAPAVSASDKVTAEIASTLDGFESSPSKESLLAHGDQETVTRALAAISQDKTQSTIRRLRAVSLLGYFSTETSRDALETALSGSDLMRREAVTAYGNAFGDKALDRTTLLLNHDDPFTRIAAIKVLGSMGTPAARLAIEARMKSEGADPVKQAGREALKPQTPTR